MVGFPLVTACGWHKEVAVKKVLSVLCLFLALSCLFVMAGCGNGSTSGTKSPGVSQTTQSSSSGDPKATVTSFIEAIKNGKVGEARGYCLGEYESGVRTADENITEVGVFPGFSYEVKGVDYVTSSADWGSKTYAPNDSCFVSVRINHGTGRMSGTNEFVMVRDNSGPWRIVEIH